ncbi:MAG: hypothetical protein JNK26_00310 [Candidatus Doudnabacteria bacterium]|nr:hypothetical protein [Candidatus Doudnabacteria bacterium]
MDKTWIRLILLAIVIMVVVIGWDIFLTVSGAKNTKEYNVIDISPNLYGLTEQHLRNDPEFFKFEQGVSTTTTTSTAGAN